MEKVNNLNTFRTKTRILYKHTDQMKVVYYGNYPEFYEIGRVELMRERGFPYAELEAMGIQMPIIEMHSKYIGSALYDELIEIETTVKERNTGIRIQFDYNIYNEAGKKINEGYTILCFIDAETRKPIRVPERIWTSLGL
ncbi:thioesterase family protein [Chishuiella sp.]|uniref:acyl-CoA thioesterase n=1 Tax=Chishuiella sp. TaxID=1969467 RepID=UPI0028A5DF0B|nr:thioesterase family protein [Chishuiella sp.]